MKKTLYLLLLLALLPSMSYSQQYFPKSDLIADLDTLYLNLRMVHPDMFTFVSQKDFEKNFEKIKISLPDSLTKVGVYAHLAQLISLLEDGHTHISFPYDDFYKENPYVLPINVTVNGVNRSLVARGRSAIPAGATIISINNMPASEIAYKAMSYSPYETWVARAMKVSSFFPAYYYMIDPSETFRVKYRFEGKNKTKKLKGTKYNVKPKKEQQEGITDKPTPTPTQNFLFSEIKPETVLFTIKEFEATSKFPPYIDSLFVYLNNHEIENLIIDIRNNPGGWGDMPIMILRYLSPEKFIVGSTHIYRAHHPLQRYDKHPTILKTELVGDTLMNVYAQNTTYFEPFEYEKRFKGDLYLLTDVGSYSASSFLAYGIKHYKLGTIVGEETGGGPPNFGNSLSFSLPKTKLDYDISAAKFFKDPEEIESMRGIIPDVEVPSEQALDKALELISHKKQK